MPVFEYECPACEAKIETVQGYHDEPLTWCQTCEADSLRRVFSLSPIHVKGYQTLGAIADRNRKKMGQYFYDKKMKEFADNKVKVSEYAGRLVEGAKPSPNPAKDIRPFWRESDVDLSLAKYAPAKITPKSDGSVHYEVTPAAEKFILEGKKT